VELSNRNSRSAISDHLDYLDIRATFAPAPSMLLICPSLCLTVVSSASLHKKPFWGLAEIHSAKGVFSSTPTTNQGRFSKSSVLIEVSADYAVASTGKRSNNIIQISRAMKLLPLGSSNRFSYRNGRWSVRISDSTLRGYVASAAVTPFTLGWRLLTKV